MRYHVDEDACIGCGLCAETCPAVFFLREDGLAELVVVRRETIVNLEKGKYNPSLKLAMDIAKVFHTTVEELFAYTED